MLVAAIPAAPASAQGSNFQNANLQGKNLQNANLRGANLQNADLQGVNLTGANLSGANLRIANLQSARLQGATLSGANLRGADLQHANLTGANLQTADLQGANLQGANLRNATLSSASLRNANLQSAILVGADLQGAQLQGANLHGARRGSATALAVASPAPAPTPVFAPTPPPSIAPTPPPEITPPRRRSASRSLPTGIAAGTPVPGFGQPPSGEIPILFNDHTVYANPDLLESGRVLAALVRNGEIMVPLRSVFEHMGATVYYNSTGKAIYVAKPGTHIRLQVNVPRIVVNGKIHPLDVPPMLYEGIILVPLRVISEGLGAYVQWVSDRHVVVIRYIELSGPPAPPQTPAPVAVATPPPSPAPVPTPVITPAPRPTPAPRTRAPSTHAPSTPVPSGSPQPPGTTTTTVVTTTTTTTKTATGTIAQTTTTTTTTTTKPLPTPPPVVVAAAEKKRVTLSVDYLIAPRVANELSPNLNVGNGSYGAQAVYQLPSGMYLVSLDFKHYQYPHKALQQSLPCSPAPTGCTTVNGNGQFQTGTCPSADPGCVTAVGFGIVGAVTGRAQEYVPAFTAQESDADLRAALKIMPRTYAGIGYLYKHFNYLGYPNIRGVGVGVTRLPNLDKQLSFFGSAWYYPSVTGKYKYPVSPFLGPLSGQGVGLGYSVLKYRVGATFWLNATTLFLEAGFTGEISNGTINAAGNEWSEGSFFGIGTRFPPPP